MKPAPTVVYVTAKRGHAEMLEKLTYDGIHFNARWMFQRYRGDRPVNHWLKENFADAVSAHYVVLYVEPGDMLCTSLLEVGHALAFGKPILIAGDRNKANELMEEFSEAWVKNLPNKGVDPWCAYHLVKITGTMDQTIEFIKNEQRTKKLTHEGK